MDTFGKLVEKQKQMNGFEYLEEEGGAAGGAMNPTGMPSDEAPTAVQQAPNASMDSSPEIKQGAGQAEKEYDKPYQDLATLLYQALRINYDDLDELKLKAFTDKKPENIVSDEHGATIFQEFEKLLRDVTTPNRASEEGEY